MKILPLFLAVFGLSGVPAAFAQGCCGTAPAPAKQAGGGCPHGAMAAGCTHEGHAAGQQQGQAQVADPKAVAAAKAALPKPVQLVFEAYIKVQNGLAEDSIQKAKAAATSLVQAVRSDTDDVLPSQISQQATALADARDLAAARAAFKPLSESLIKYAKSSGITPGAYVEVYCSMAKAGWLQSDKAVKNPYYGSSMLTCGQVKS